MDFDNNEEDNQQNNQKVKKRKIPKQFQNEFFKEGE